MRKIAYITNAPPQGGMGKPAREIYNNLPYDWFSTDIFYMDVSKNKMLKNGTEINSLPVLPGPLNIKPLKWWRFAKFLPSRGYDLWHLTNQTLSFITRKPNVITVYDLIELLAPQEKLGRPVAKFLYKGIPNANHVICISDYTKKMVQENYQVADEKISVIPLGVSKQFSPLRGVRESVRYFEFLSQNNFPKNAKIVLYVGSDHPRKNLLVLAEAFAQVKKAIPEAFWVKVGDPGLQSGREALTKKLDELKVRDSVRFIGNISDEDLQFLYSIADVFVFPSTYEGFGIPPLEAMSCGCPVITSNATSLPEVVGNAGMTYEPNDVNGFASAIKLILTNKQEAGHCREKGIERSKSFSWESITEKTVDVYEKVLLEATPGHTI